MSIAKYPFASQAPNSKSFWSFGHWRLFVICILLFGVFGLKDASAATISKPTQSLGLVGYWSFDVGKGTAKAVDMSGRGNNGTLTNMNTTTAWVGGKIGQALNFDGVDDYAATSGITGFNNTAITISAWVKQRSASNGYSVIAGDVSKIQGLFALQGNQFFQLNFSGDYPGTGNVSVSLIDGWHLLTGTWSSGSTIKIYVDGAFVKESSSIYTGAVIAWDNIDIGKAYSAGGYFNGLIDEVRIYNRALSADEIKRLYRQTSPQMNASQANKLRQGLVGMWTFDGNDMSGNTAIDRSGQGNNGTLTNGPKKVIGKIGQALNFDGVNDIVRASTFSQTTFSQVSVSAWVYSNNYGKDYQGIVSDGAYRHRLELRMSSTTRKPQFVVSDSDITYLATAASALSNGSWYHITGTFDKFLSSENVKIFVNGVQQGTGNFTGDSVFLSSNLDIGTIQNSASYAWNGLIDEVRVYNRALTEAEIRQLYKAGSSFHPNVTNKSTIRDGLVGHWSFDGNDMGTTSARDASGNANTGWLINGTKKAIGKIGQALNFDGVDDFVSLGTPSSLNLTGETTLFAWVKLNTVAISTQTIIAQCTGGGNGGQHSLEVGRTLNKVSLVVANSAIHTSISSITAGTWYHIGYTWSGSSGNWTSRIYINGVLDKTTTSTTNPGTQQSMSIGRCGAYAPSGYTNGLIDEVRVYNRALAPDEIKRLYNMGR